MSLTKFATDTAIIAKSYDQVSDCAPFDCNLFDGNDADFQSVIHVVMLRNFSVESMVNPV